jgi:hypothetical protein
MEIENDRIAPVAALYGDPLVETETKPFSSIALAAKAGRANRSVPRLAAKPPLRARRLREKQSGVHGIWFLQKSCLTDISIIDIYILVNRYITYRFTMNRREGRQMPGTHHLFTVTRWLLNAGMLFSLLLTGVLALAFGACVLGAAGVIHLPIPAGDMKEMKDISLALLFTAGAVACASGVFLLGLLSLLLMMTARIVKTADTDPFVEGNARRLMQIGWLLLAMQAVGLTAGMVMEIFPKQITDHVQAGFDFEPVALLGALLIFVLAQIFRRGAQMRAELEGTV